MSKLTVAELKKYLTDDIKTIDIEDYDGNTIFTIDLSQYGVADVEDNVLRMQREV